MAVIKHGTSNPVDVSQHHKSAVKDTFMISRSESVFYKVTILTHYVHLKDLTGTSRLILVMNVVMTSHSMTPLQGGAEYVQIKKCLTN